MGCDDFAPCLPALILDAFAPLPPILGENKIGGFREPSKFVWLSTSTLLHQKRWVNQFLNISSLPLPLRTTLAFGTLREREGEAPMAYLAVKSFSHLFWYDRSYNTLRSGKPDEL
jgi:hypothetical protein